MRQNIPLLVFVGLIALLVLVTSSRERAVPPPPDFSKDCLMFEKVEAESSIVAVSGTDAGMHALWAPQSFRNICAFEAWEHTFLGQDGFRKVIGAGAFVPIYIHSDGAVLVDLRVGTREHPAVFGEIPNGRIARQSKPFLFVSHGHIALSGIEYIYGNTDSSARVMPLSAGRWTVVIAQVDVVEGVAREEGSKVPNFIALVNPEVSSETVYAQTEETFQ